MMKLKFVQLDVFNTTRFLGNPLAIVHVPQGVMISQSQKQIIAKEFNLSETVFLHERERERGSSESDSRTSAKAPVSIDIFTTTEELPFAGHPTVGTGWYLLSQAQAEADAARTITLKTKAGEIPVQVVRRDHDGLDTVMLQIPIDFKIHTPFLRSGFFKTLQPHLDEDDYVNGKTGAEAVVSIVKGMTFVLLELASEEALVKMRPFPERIVTTTSELGLGDWAGFVGVYAFFERMEDGVVRTRMFDGSNEDPATGSAASALAGWLAKKKGPGEWTFEIVQGVEMGRRSEIMVKVDVGTDGEVRRIDLGGSAVEVMQGLIYVE